MKETGGRRLLVGTVTILSIVFALVVTVHLYAAPVTTVGADDIKGAVVAYIRGHMPWPAENVRMEFSSGISDVTLTGTDITCRVSCRRTEDFIGDASFTVSFYDNGVFMKKRHVRVRLEVLRDVVVAARSLARGIEITDDDVSLVQKWFHNIPTGIPVDIEDVVGKRLRCTMKMHAEIRKNMVKDIPLVKKGKVVRIVIERQPLKITTIGVSEQDGMRGDLVKVRNVSSSRSIYARVMADSLVCVEF